MALIDLLLRRADRVADAAEALRDQAAKAFIRGDIDAATYTRAMEVNVACRATAQRAHDRWGDPADVLADELTAEDLDAYLY